MGMFDKDVLYGGERLDHHVEIGADSLSAERVLLLDCAIISDEVPTSLGNATKSGLVICKLDKTGTKTEGESMVVNTLASAIGDKVRLKSDGDLPAIVCFFRTESQYDTDATVMQFVGRWDGKTPAFQPIVETIPF